MKARQKILIFCPPFSGHFNVIKDLVVSVPNHNHWKIVVTGWTNIAIELGELTSQSVILAEDELHETDPALWTFPRVVQLLDKSLQIATDFQPDLIVYDFFSLEGKLVGDILDIPVYASIPAFVGDFSNKDYLADKLQHANNKSALKILADKYQLPITTDDLEMISDGLHLPADLNLVWSYKSVTPIDFMNNRHPKPYVFVGSAKKLLPTTTKPSKNAQPTIYLSFGTVVMNNLWNQQKDLQQRIKSFIETLAGTWANEPWTIIFATQGKQILKNYPDNWIVENTVDQVAILATADLFITHGGSNSFHESLRAKTPQIIIPFFGDQPLVASRAAELGIGLNMVPHAIIDTHASKAFLNEALAQSVDRAVRQVLSDSSFQANLKAINLHHENIYSLIDGSIQFQEGDLLFGTNVARKKYVEENDLQSEFTILKFKAFSELAPGSNSLPRIVDIYHDVILNDEYFALDTQSNMRPYISHLHDYKEYLAGETDFEKMCIKGLDFFSRYYKIKFILSDFDPSINRITKAEITYILNNADRFKDSVTFYKKHRKQWVELSYSDVYDYIH